MREDDERPRRLVCATLGGGLLTFIFLPYLCSSYNT